MISDKWVSAGLVFLDRKDLDIVAAGKQVCHGLDALDARVSELRMISQQCCRITTKDHELRLALRWDHKLEALDRPAALYLNIRIRRTGAEQPASGALQRCDTILAHLLRALLREQKPDFVKWIGPNALIRNADFVRATAQLDDPSSNRRKPIAKRPKTGSPARLLPQIEEHSERLDQLLQQEASWTQAPSDQHNLRRAYHGVEQAVEVDTPAQPAQDISEDTPLLRLSTWFMSYAVALFCLPVGITLMIVNLLRGENLRLSSQAAALTGMFLSLEAAGSVAQAATALQSFYG